MNAKRFSILAAALALLLSLCACQGNASTTLPDLSALGEIRVIAREKGSGTRSEFETLTGSSEAGADGVATSTQEVLDQVVGDMNAIGYLAFSAIPENAAVRILAVNGTAPDTASIRKGSYPLCRSYILAHMGDLSDLGTDFLTCILGAGQEIVSGSCIPVKEATSFLSDRSAGTLFIRGSTSMALLMEQLIANYRTYNPDADIQLTVSDSTDGLTAAIRGECDLAMSSRSLKDYESELLDSTVIATDAIAVVVNPANPLTNLTADQLKGIFDGDTARWADLKG